MSGPRNVEQRQGLSDSNLWWLGLSCVVASGVASSVGFDSILTVGVLPAVASFLIAYFVRQRPLLKALACWPIMVASIIAADLLRNGYKSSEFMTYGTVVLSTAQVLAVPIFTGALAGWLVRRLRG